MQCLLLMSVKRKNNTGKAISRPHKDVNVLFTKGNLLPEGNYSLHRIPELILLTTVVCAKIRHLLMVAIFREAHIISVKPSPVNSTTAQQSQSAILSRLENSIMVNSRVFIIIIGVRKSF